MQSSNKQTVNFTEEHKKRAWTKGIVSPLIEILNIVKF